MTLIKKHHFETFGACEEFIILTLGNIQSTKNVGIFCLGACEVAWSLQARLAGLHGFYDRVPQRGGVEKIINLSEWMKSPWALKSD